MRRFFGPTGSVNRVTIESDVLNLTESYYMAWFLRDIACPRFRMAPISVACGSGIQWHLAAAHAAG